MMLLFPLLFLSSQALALVARSKPRQYASTYPFSNLIAFGDELSDNGNGSFAHGITGDPATVYGFGTWTNGPVAVSYLADLLDVPLTDYAFGGCCGGGSFGATIDSNYTASPAGSPSVTEQIANYTSSNDPNTASSLGFIWAGQNDLGKHTDAFWLGDPHNTDFANTLAFLTANHVQKLLDTGMPYVLVANIYPKHLAPVTSTYLCGTSASCIDTWGEVIQHANTQLQTTLLSQFGDKVIFYDVFSFLTDLLNNAQGNGFTQPLDFYCDGDGSSPKCQWDLCMVQGQADEFFWMNFVQPTTRVHELIAGDMKRIIDQAFAV